MGRAIIRIGEYYLEWSTIVDAPVTYGMSLDDFKKHYRQQYGEQGMEELPARLERVEANGASWLSGKGAEDTILCNRAGPQETVLTKEQIHRAYCLGETIEGWSPR